eukprot:Gb_20631 [translate_table: standard]
MATELASIEINNEFQLHSVATNGTSRKVRIPVRIPGSEFEANLQENNSGRDIEEGRTGKLSEPTSGPCIRTVTFFQKLGAEFVGTFFLIFAGCGSVIIDVKSKGSITHVGVSAVWGLIVLIMIYSLGHISGAHFNPAITVAFATVRCFPWNHVCII